MNFEIWNKKFTSNRKLDMYKIKKGICIILIIVSHSSSVFFGQESKYIPYTVMDSTTSTLLDFSVGVISLYGDEKIDHSYVCIDLIGVEVKHFIFEKFRIDLSVLGTFTFVDTIKEKDHNDTETVFRPHAQIRANYAFFYRTKHKDLNVTLRTDDLSYYIIRDTYISVPTVTNRYFNVYSAFYAGYLERRLSVGINYTSISYVKIDYGERKAIRYFDVGVEFLYALGYADIVQSRYNNIEEDVKKVGWYSYISFPTYWRNGLKGYIGYGNLRGSIVKLGLIVTLPL